MPKGTPISIPFPLRGLDEGAGYDRQPDGTTSDLLNVRGHDSIARRRRGGRRAGMSKWLPTALGSTHIQTLLPISQAAALGAAPVSDHTLTVSEPIDTSQWVFEELNATLDTAPVWSWPIGSGGGLYGTLQRDNFDRYYAGLGRDMGTWPNGGVVEAPPGQVTPACVWKLSDDALPLSIWSFWCGGADNFRTMQYDKINHRLLVGGKQSSNWTSGSTQANLWCLDAADGSVLWSMDLDSSKTDIHEVTEIHVDSSGNWYVTAPPSSNWPGASSVRKSIWKIDKDGTILASFDTGSSITFGPHIDLTPDGGIVSVSSGDSTDWMGQTGAAAASIFVWLDTNLGVPTKNHPSITAYLGDHVRVVGLRNANSDYAIGYTISNNSRRLARCQFGSSNGNPPTIVWGVGAGGAMNTSTMGIRKNNDIMISGPSADPGGTVNIATHSPTNGDVTDTWASTTTTGVSDCPESHILDTNSTPVDNTDEQLMAVENGDIRLVKSAIVSIPVNGVGAMSNVPATIHAAQLFTDVFLVDGTNEKYLDLTGTPTVLPWTATAGTVPPDTRLITRYRGRIVVAGSPTDGHNWHMSKVGDAFDWDTGVVPATQVMAVSGNNSDTGLVGDVITALIPFSDDALIFGCSKSVWMLAGDPAANGRIDLVTDDTGILFGKAWAMDPNGVLYFASVDGIYRLVIGQKPEPIMVNKFRKRWEALDFSQLRVHLAWDSLRHGLIVSLVPSSFDAVVEGFFWDAALDAWYRDTYTSTDGPNIIVSYMTQSVEDRAMLVGSRDGFVRQYDDAALDDDGTGITNNVRSAPIGLTDGNTEGIITGIEVTLADGSGDVQMKVYTGQTAEQCAASTTPRVARTVSAGQNAVANQRIRGKYVQVELAQTAASTRWALESVTVIVEPAGPAVRRKRA